MRLQPKTIGKHCLHHRRYLRAGRVLRDARIDLEKLRVRPLRQPKDPGVFIGPESIRVHHYEFQWLSRCLPFRRIAHPDVGEPDSVCEMAAENLLD